MKMIFEEAMAIRQRIRFVTNFCRLLKRYHLDIRSLASTSVESAAVGLLRSRGARMRVAEAVAATIYEAHSPQIKAQQTYHEDHFYPRRYDCREKSFEYDFHEEKGV